MTFELNPLAVTAAPLLRALKAAEWTSKKDLAERAGRHPNHIQRDLKVLAENGLVADVEPFALTAEGEAQLAALDRAGDPNAAGAPTALHADLEPHPLNPRKDFETPEAEEALDELRISIIKSGLLQPIVVRPRPDNGKWWIVAGERRWRAIGQAISDGDWEEDLPVAITIREVDDRDHLLLALNENLQRSNMKAIEEGVAFAAAVHEFGLPTEELANRTGKSQRYVQQRIALLKLSQDDQDRMRLPKAHPSYLSFKDARSQTQTARQPTPEVEAEADEPGSPPEPDFDRLITDREALMLVEVADKSDRQPDSLLASEYYTSVQGIAQEGYARDLVSKGLVAFRQRGDVTLIRPLLHSSGLKVWLTGLGFYGEGRDLVLFEMRTRVHGADVARTLAGQGKYATAWLNPAGGPPPLADGSSATSSGDGAAYAGEVVAAGGLVCRPDPSLTQDEIDEAFAATGRRIEEVSRSQPEEPEQPALIEETPDEIAARVSRVRRAIEAADDDRALDTFTGWMRDKLAQKRAAGATGWQDPKRCEVKDLADLLVGHVGKGDPVDIALFAMMLGIRAGAMGAPGYLRSMPTPRMERLMIEARTPPRSLMDGPEEPDPVEDFVQAELEDEEADGGGVLTVPHYTPGPHEPAVPIRKSITADHIVCLEDGRKFKSLKRHLRVKYNLSPEQYRAKWALPVDYPMVAPNYAKAREDLARQMGLRS